MDKSRWIKNILLFAGGVAAAKAYDKLASPSVHDIDEILRSYEITEKPIYASYSPESLAFIVFRWMYLSGPLSSMVGLGIPLTSRDLISIGSFDSWSKWPQITVEESEEDWIQGDGVISSSALNRISSSYEIMQKGISKALSVSTPTNAHSFLRALEYNNEQPSMLHIYVKAKDIFFSHPDIVSIFNSIQRDPQPASCLSAPSLRNALQLAGIRDLHFTDTEEFASAITVTSSANLDPNQEGIYGADIEISKPAFSHISEAFLSAKNEAISAETQLRSRSTLTIGARWVR